MPPMICASVSPRLTADGTENPAVARVRVDVVMVWVSQIDGSVRSVSVP